jgi:NMD protein affecting ribosome stability and mRNA decay
MSTKIKISCDEATQICDKNQYGEATIWEKIKLSIHLVLCHHCKSYTKQNTLVTKIIGKYLDVSEKSKHLTAEEKAVLKANFQDKISK